VPGALPAAIGANAMGKGLICPAACGAEAAWAGEDVDILAAPHLLSLVTHFKGSQTLSRPKPNVERDCAALPDLRDVKGQESAKRVLKVAAAGGQPLDDRTAGRGKVDARGAASLDPAFSVAGRDARHCVANADSMSPASSARFFDKAVMTWGSAIGRLGLECLRINQPKVRPMRAPKNPFAIAAQRKPKTLEPPPAPRRLDLEQVLCKAMSDQVRVEVRYEGDMLARVFEPTAELRLTLSKFVPDPRFDLSDPKYRFGIICSV
jgi:hypothetical protein